MNICITSCGRTSAAACALLLHGLAVLPSFAQGTITQTEPNDSIGTATLTGIAAGSSVLKVTQGHSGDGPFGEFGDMSGDVDFFKVSANAGQTILVNMANGGIDADFDPYAAIYDAAGTLVAEGDDRGNTPRGYDRTPSFTYPVTVSGDYYVCVSNWVENTTSLPSDPTTPGSGPGLASGNSGPYQLVIGLDAELPVVQFVGGVSGYPVPAFLPDKIFGTPRREGILTISNRSAGTTPASALTITGFNITGPDASRYFVKGLLPPVTIPAGGRLDVPIAFNAVGMGNEAQATLNLVSNDPLNQAYSLNSFSPVEGGGFFQVKQVNAPAGTAVNSFDTADQLLDGTIAGGTVFTGTTSRINYGAGNGRFGSDLPFLNGGTTPENIVLQVTGPVNIRADGDYTFFGISDDGQRLRINGQEVFQNTGYDQDTFGTVNLTAGIHQIEYTMYEGGGGNHAELAITQQPISISSFVSATWELLEAAGADTDGDGMPDAYESANGLSISSAAGNDGASGDPDADGSSNANEYFLGTNPKLPDTDSDGLLDGVESGTGVWAGPGNTGTDPLIADTDLDGLLDGVENPGLPSTGLSQPGTSPVKKDTDNDGVADAIEISLGSDPLSAASVPAAFTFKPMLSEDFDENSFHSTFAINRLNGTETFEPKVGDSFDLIHQFTAKLTGSSNSNHNTITWDYVDGPAAPALQISVDFRMGSDGGFITNPADGFGIGLFRKSVYGTSGISPAIVDSKSWENPAGGGGYADALFFGFGVYGTDSIRVLGPADPAVPLAVQFPTFPLLNDLFNRAIITVVSNTPDSSMVKLEMIMDVDGAATSHTVFENVLVPGFVVSGEEVRLIAGARTGGLFTPVEIDNVKVSVPDQVTPSVVLSNTFNSFLVDIYDGTAPTSIVNPGSITAAVNGIPVSVSPVKTGAVTTIDYAEAQGGLFPPGTNTLVINYTSTTGAVFSETRSFVVPSYFLLPPALAVSPARGFIPGFGIKTWQAVPVTAGQTLPGSIDYAEALLGGAHGDLFTGANEADLTLADGNAVFIRETINLEQTSGAAGYFGGDVSVPGIPGIQGSTDNYLLEALVWVEFPAAGLYNLGVNADDGFRLSVGHAPVTPLLSVAVPVAAARVVAAAPSVLNEGGAFGTLPSPPLTRKLVVAVPPLADVALTNGAEMAGNIALVERGNVTFATKIKNAQDAGAAGVIVYNNTANEAALPFAMGGDATITGITISGIMVSRSDGLSLAALAAAPGGVEVQYGSDRSTTVGFANPNAITNFTVGVSTPGLYPLRFLNFEGGGGANAEIYSVDAFGVRHLVNDPFDVDALKAYAVLADGPAAILTRTVAGELLIHFKGILQGSPDLGSFSDIVGVDSPYVIPAGTTGRMFFRARP